MSATATATATATSMSTATSGLDSSGPTGPGTQTGPGPDSSAGMETTSDDSDSMGSATGTSTGEVLPDGQWAMTQITYSDGVTQEVLDLDDCVFCDATLNEVTVLVRFQQAEGWTVWTLDIPVGSTVGSQPITDDYSGAYAAINEQGPGLPPEFTGFYAPTTGSGTLTLTEADITPGGVVAGTVDVQLMLGGVSADLQAEFYAEIP